MWADFLVASRSLRRSPIFTATASRHARSGIGASTAIFSVVHAVLLRPLPFCDPSQLVRIWEANLAEGNERALVSAANFNDWRSRSRTFEDAFPCSMRSLTQLFLGVGDASIQAKQAVVTPNLFALHLCPTGGRTGDLACCRRNAGHSMAPRLTLESWALAACVWSASPVLSAGRDESRAHAGSVVVGVMPPGFSFPDGTDFWTPMDATRAGAARRGMRMYGAIGGSHRTSVLPQHGRICSPSPSLSRARTRPAMPEWTIAAPPPPRIGRGKPSAGARDPVRGCFVRDACRLCQRVQPATGSRYRPLWALAPRAALGASRARIVRLLLRPRPLSLQQ